MTHAEIARLAREMMDQHGLRHWRFAWDRGVVRLGACHYRKRVISLSARLVTRTSDEQIRDTILHEIAHAKAGPGTGHGPYWKALARQIGCSAERCYSSAAVEPVPGKWQATCPSCGKQFHRHRRVSDSRKRFCRRCGREKGILTYAKVF